MQKMRKREGRVNRKREFIILSCCTRVCKDDDDVRNKNMFLASKMRKFCCLPDIIPKWVWRQYDYPLKDFKLFLICLYNSYYLETFEQYSGNSLF